MIRIARDCGKAAPPPLPQRHRRLLEVLRGSGRRSRRHRHAFSGSLETARQLIDLGFASASRVVTFPAARRLNAVVRSVPAEWLVLESDAPDLPPHPHRGEANRPHG